MLEKLILVDPVTELCIRLEEYFKDLPNVEIINDGFEKLPHYDCMVSAANSFGLMDGGVDAAIINYFGIDLMKRVQQRIIEEYLGEQPVGTSMIVETNHPEHPYIAHTPTMRVPLDIRGTDNIYLAMWAMLRAVHMHNQSDTQPKIKIVACPGLGTLTGGVSFKEAARQMALAYKNYLKPIKHIDWKTADARQREVIYGGYYGFKLPTD